MKIVFFIDKSNSYFLSLIDFLEFNFPDYIKEYYIIDRRKEVNIPDKSNVHRILRYSEFILNIELRKAVMDCDKVVASGIFTLQYVLPLFSKKVLQKTYLQFWGGDMYVFRKHTFKIAAKKYFVNICVKNCAGVINLVSSEREEFKKFFPYDKKFFASPVPGGPKSDELNKKYRDLSMLHENKGQRRIVIGNSATVSNRHLDLFEKLKKIDWKDVKIYCPLTYGDMNYRDMVIEKGAEFFGENFHPLIKQMEYEEYMSFLMTCSVGIYNHNRQQGLGNISMLLNMGKKVYVPQNGFAWKHYTSYGYKLNNVDDLSTQTLEQIFKWTDDDRQKNFDSIDKRKEDIIAEWRKILGN